MEHHDEVPSATDLLRLDPGEGMAARAVERDEPFSRGGDGRDVDRLPLLEPELAPEDRRRHLLVAAEREREPRPGLDRDLDFGGPVGDPHGRGADARPPVSGRVQRGPEPPHVRLEDVVVEHLPRARAQRARERRAAGTGVAAEADRSDPERCPGPDVELDHHGEVPSRARRHLGAAEAAPREGRADPALGEREVGVVERAPRDDAGRVAHRLLVDAGALERDRDAVHAPDREPLDDEPDPRAVLAGRRRGGLRVDDHVPVPAGLEEPQHRPAQLALDERVPRPERDERPRRRGIVAGRERERDLRDPGCRRRAPRLGRARRRGRRGGWIDRARGANRAGPARRRPGGPVPLGAGARGRGERGERRGEDARAAAASGAVRRRGHRSFHSQRSLRSSPWSPDCTSGLSLSHWYWTEVRDPSRSSACAF